MKIIAFTGMPFSGKSEAVKIAKDKGIPVIRMGDMIWREVKNRGLELSDENVGRIANDMRNTHGKAIWAERTIEKIKNMKIEDRLIIDGVRNIEEIEVFKKELNEEFLLVAVDVPNDIRYERAMNRDRADDSKNLEKIKERDHREQGWGLREVIDSADIIIVNDDGLERFQNDIKKALEKI